MFHIIIFFDILNIWKMKTKWIMENDMKMKDNKALTNKQKNSKTINGVHKRKTINGFTIVELVIVIAVIAILAAVLIPVFTGVLTDANVSVDKQNISTLNK